MSRSIQPDSLISDLRPIVADLMPAELDAFDVSAPQLIAQLNHGVDIRKASDAGRGRFEFGEGATKALEFITLLWGTYQALEGMYKLAKKIPMSEFKSYLRTCLIDGGFSEQKVNAAVEHLATREQSSVLELVANKP